MTADRATHDDSTPRRGFGLARFVMRAVSGALEPVRKAAEGVVRKAEAAKRSRAHEAAKAAAAAARRRAVPLEQRLMALAPEIRRQFFAVMEEGWRRLQPPPTLLRSIRRYYLGTAAAAHAFPRDRTGHARRAHRDPRAEWDTLWSWRADGDAVDRHGPQPAMLGHSVSGLVQPTARSPAAVEGWLTPASAPLRPI